MVGPADPYVPDGQVDCDNKLWFAVDVGDPIAGAPQLRKMMLKGEG